jgi:hypothetical protein
MNIAGPIKRIIDDNATADALLDGRLYPMVAPQNVTLPYAVIQRISNRPSNTKSGPSTLDQVMVQVSVWGTTYATAEAAAEAVRGALDFWRGDVVIGPVTYSFDGISFQDCRDMYDPNSEVFGVSYDFKCRYQRGTTIGINGLILDYYTDDAEAEAAGLIAEQLYKLDSDNPYGVPRGTVKAVNIDLDI